MHSCILRTDGNSRTAKKNPKVPPRTANMIIEFNPKPEYDFWLRKLNNIYSVMSEMEISSLGKDEFQEEIRKCREEMEKISKKT